MNLPKSHQCFLIECSAPHWINVANQLKALNIHVSYWTGWSRIKPDVNLNCNEAIFHDTFYAKIANDPANTPYPFQPFNDVCLSIWEKESQTVYEMMNRFDHSRDQSFVEKSLLFSHHLTYWNTVLAQKKPDLVVFSTPPHVVYDYILLALCRALSIKTLMYEEATIFPPYCLSMSDYTEGSTSLSAESKNQHVISEETLEIVAKLKGNYNDAKPLREVIAHKNMQESINAGLKGLQERARAVKALDSKHVGRYENNEKIVNVSSAYKQKNVSLRQSFNAPYANSMFMDQVIEERHVTNQLRDLYNSKITPLNQLKQPFIYVAMAGQPERTSCPQAGVFSNQLLMLNLIAHSIPKDWAMAVREHPNQFHPEFAVNMYRSVDYYDLLFTLPNTYILSTNEDPFHIIDQCQLIATSGGTTALESIARGKPALLFGDAWYKDCPGVHRIRTQTDIINFFEQFETIKIDEKNLYNFVESIKKGCFEGLGDYPPDGYPVSQEKNADNLTSTILKALEYQALVISE